MTANNGGFVAGTLVHTDKGLIPIQDIKIGDMVLSKPENGIGEPVYKPVLKTFIHEDKEIYWQTEAESKADGKAYDNYYINKGFVVGGLVQDDHQNVGLTNSLVDKHGDYIPFTRNVYNIEAADNHTYFVGRNNIWVSN